MSSEDHVEDEGGFEPNEDQFEVDGRSKKRRKAIKQCLFCRKRKLKCDKKKPMCTTCVTRGLGECIYVEQFGRDVSARELLNSAPNVDLLNKIKALEKELDSYKHTSLTKGEGFNPLRDVQILIKKDERTIYHGCTSFRAALSESRFKFSTYHAFFWARVKDDRRRWKALNGYTTLKEITVIEKERDNGLSVLGAVCKALPPFEQIEAIVKKFFTSILLEGYKVLDMKKTLQNLHMSFIRGPQNPITGMHPVIHLWPSFKKNYYCIGIILEIMCLMSYSSVIPEAIDVFNKYLTSFVTKKAFYIERVQYLFLRYLYKSLNYGGGDDSNLVFLAQAMSASAICVGLHRNIRDLLKGDNVDRGDAVYFENLWLWILQADLETSFNVGTPPKIAESFVNYQMIEDPNYGSCELLKNLIRPMRNIMTVIYLENRIPDMEAIVGKIKRLLETHFKPLKLYREKENLKQIPFVEIDLYTWLLGMIGVFSNFRRVYFKDHSPSAINSALQFTILPLAMSMSTIEAFFELDKEAAAKTQAPLQGGLPFHLAIANSLVQKHFPRSLSEIYTLMGSLGSFPDFGTARFQYPLSPVFDIPLDSLECVGDHYVSFKQASEVIENLLSKWEEEKNRDMVKLLKRYSYAFVVSYAIQKSHKDLFDQCFKRRELQFTRGEEQSNPDMEQKAALPSPSNSFGGQEFIPDETLKELADEFWKNYDIEVDDFFSDAFDQTSIWFDSSAQPQQ
ncbi:KLTH0A07260p [Lachancea thermotolerans CBS 6340]|uniref:KLTH0A07260p n=1 Tax=Lachancea thermotolerans (strain ATCC 56472 / CBS 6340 / NRRL Y-8284) TaxID=559295 RepID=C5DC25_LACTC|nr:KLTH0A07260p [Lachancea thermotolerans CBS 6340]CAR21332.1 KLTH0A07260p [Lachancea thermotolerans CBS 6340]